MDIKKRLLIKISLIFFAAFIFGIFYIAYFSPKFKILSEKKDEITRIRERYKRLIAEMSSHPDIDNIILKEKQRKEKLDNSIPALKTSPDVIHAIDAEIKNAKIELVYLKQTKLTTITENNTEISQLELSLSIKSNFFTFIRFLRNVYSKDVVVQIRDMHIIRDNSLYPVLIINLNILIFFR